jgi:SAM-dependent methyltransferase
MRSDSGQAFGYTDGADLERALLEFLDGTEDRSVLSSTLLAQVGDWPRRYHFSPRRANLLRPLASFLQGKRVLEIGAGCGAITRYLGECGCDVLAIEGSVARARVAAARCADLNKVSVVAETLQAFEPRPRFDVVSLIGVLEYARIFFPAREGEDPVDAMLACAARFLAPGGVLLVAIENQLGLKYFAGYHEDHVSDAMFGVEDRYQPTGVVTFGRAELSSRLRRAGLGCQEWLYPFPDYKLPVAVLSERGVRAENGVDLGPLAVASVAADPQTPSSMSFALEAAWRPVMRNGLGGELANSFLAIASTQAQEVVDQDALAWHFSVERAKPFAKQTVFRVRGESVWVEPERLEADAHGAVQGALTMRIAATPFQRGELWQQALLTLLNEPGWTAERVVRWAARWLACLEAFHPALAGCRDVDFRLPGRMLDAVPRNMLVEGEQQGFIDLEWELEEGVSLGHLCYRAIVQSLTGVASVAPPADEADLSPVRLFGRCMSALGFGEPGARLAEWHEQERTFQKCATGVDIPREFSSVEAFRLAVRAGQERSR